MKLGCLSTVVNENMEYSKGVNSPAFSVKAAAFEGPLDVLLSLVEKRKMHISDVSLAAITDDYLKFITGEPLPIAQTADFIFLAATLMLIKSRSLLPRFSISHEEEGDIRELEARLAHYEAIRGRAQLLRSEIEPRKLFWKQLALPLKKEEVRFRPGKEGSTLLAELHSSLRRLASLMPTPEKIPQTRVEKKVRLEEVMHSLMQRLSHSLATTLGSFAGAEKQDTILGFLAILELVKQGAVHAHQADHGSEIHIESLSLGVPRYH